MLPMLKGSRHDRHPVYFWCSCQARSRGTMIPLLPYSVFNINNTDIVVRLCCCWNSPVIINFSVFENLSNDGNVKYTGIGNMRCAK